MIYKTNEKGELHCLDGPAIVYDDGSYTWYKDNNFHCETGPAIYRPQTAARDKICRYYLDGEPLAFSSDEEIIREVLMRKMIGIIET